MIGHDHLRYLVLGDVDVHFMSLYQMWANVENFMVIDQDLILLRSIKIRQRYEGLYIFAHCGLMLIIS